MNKKLIGIIVAIVAILTLGGITYYVLNHQDNNTLTLLEKQWIQSHKNNMIDIDIENDIPIFSYDGEGLIYEFLEDLEKNTELGFNKLPLNDSNKSAYSIKMTDTLDKNDIVMYEDNYALISKENVKYNSLSNIKDLTIGVLSNNLEDVEYYLKGSNLAFKSYEKVTDLLEAINNGNVKAIVLPKSMYLKTILENNLTISYNITEMKENLVIHLGNEKRLNNILKKYFEKWSKDSFNKSFSTNLSNNYYEYTKVSNDDQVNFKSKRYKYGFVANIPYDILINNKLVGYNSEVIKEFSKISDIEVTYHEYDSYAKLIKDFNENKIDFFFNPTNNEKYDMDVSVMPAINDEEIVVLSNIKNDIIINSVSSIKDAKVLSINNTLIASYLEENKINVKKYNNIDELLKNIGKASIIVLDKSTYEMYKTSKLKDFEISYNFKLDKSYNYTSREIKDNHIFNNYFAFYLTFMNTKSIMNRIDYKTFEVASKLAFIKPLLFTLFAIIGLLIITIVVRKVKENKANNKIGVSKEDKLRYIDMLTSLKNRNYLNDTIEKWDESGIYPQTIVIVDLNNVAYINDNYGHNEGDNVIKEAANILIKNQMEQSEIIRTNGNEFLIYLVGYEEKQVVTYIRKLLKEFKELEHGFGAAIGYSVIADGLKTVDDAINEATLDMKTNKEETHE
ncbi:MAG: GGDEF domain-containing protein [Bacilli bacterium]|nr:GGDEF domain-containing protein [Bacilli bacterium]